MKNCRFCNSEKIIKHSFINDKQRFECKECGKYQLARDGRQKYSQKVIKTAFILFFEGNNYRTIIEQLQEFYQKFLREKFIIKL
jgi:transposase-like protein